MPVNGSDRSYDHLQAQLRQKAKDEVRLKFPDLPENSSGWFRAFNNRYVRLCQCQLSA